jgi:hypothetical protein
MSEKNEGEIEVDSVIVMQPLVEPSKIKEVKQKKTKLNFTLT